jgi:hypothetical protein
MTDQGNALVALWLDVSPYAWPPARLAGSLDHPLCGLVRGARLNAAHSKRAVAVAGPRTSSAPLCFAQRHACLGSMMLSG